MNPPQVQAIYDKCVADAGVTATEFGPAHVVWSDSNFDRSLIQWCLDNFSDFTEDYSAEEMAAVRISLTSLLALDDVVLDAADGAYFGKVIGQT